MHGRRRDGGQAAVEFAVALPLVVVLVLVLLQVVVIARDQIAVELAAREGARAASVAASPAAAADRAARAATTLRPLEVATTVSASTVRVEVSTDHPTEVPLVGRIIRRVRLHADVTMRREPP